jgi:hypothetical protein
LVACSTLSSSSGSTFPGGLALASTYTSSIAILTGCVLSCVQGMVTERLPISPATISTGRPNRSNRDFFRWSPWNRRLPVFSSYL